MPDIKPAGQQAEFRSVASMKALRATENPSQPDQAFANMAAVWVGELLPEGLVFREHASKQCWISMGFISQSVLFWKLDEVEDSCHSFASFGWEYEHPV